MKVAFVASECTPIVKVGGLGDVIGSLPKALHNLGVNTTVLIPGYCTIDYSSWVKTENFVIHFAGEPLKIEVFSTQLPGSVVQLTAFRENKYIGSGGVYFSKTAFSSSQDEINRFVVFNEAVACWLSKETNKVDIVHAHDWHAALLLHLLDDGGVKVKKVFTIHNLANQGMSSLEVDAKLGGHIDHDKLLAWDATDHSLDLMLQGLGRADWITTVSPTYAKEILTSEYGEHINEIIASHQKPIHGITNGLDTVDFNPTTDKSLYQTYDLAFLWAGVTHTISASRIDRNSVTLLVKSTPSLIMLDAGESETVDLDDDLLKDIAISLVSAENNQLPKSWHIPDLCCNRRKIPNWLRFAEYPHQKIAFG